MQDIVQIDMKGGIKRTGKFHEEIKHNWIRGSGKDKSARRNNQVFTGCSRTVKIYSSLQTSKLNYKQDICTRGTATNLRIARRQRSCLTETNSTYVYTFMMRKCLLNEKYTLNESNS